MDPNEHRDQESEGLDSEKLQQDHEMPLESNESSDDEEKELQGTTKKSSGMRINFRWIVLLFLITVSSGLLVYGEIARRARADLRGGITDYLVFSHSIHMRSYWAMSNIDYAIEAAQNDGDYGRTTKFYPMYANRALRQAQSAQSEIDAYNESNVPAEARTSYQLMCDCIDDLETLSSTLRNMPYGYVAYDDLVADSMITTWSSREALRNRFDVRYQSSVRPVRNSAVSSGYDWVYEDMRLKAYYDIVLDQGQAMFQSNVF